jgi:hypothetical protein
MEEWTPDNPEDFVKQIDNLNAKTIHIRGGNPLLKWDYLLRIVKAVRQTPLKLVVTTHGIGRSINELVDLCIGGQVKFNIIMFGIDEATSNAVCGKDILSHQMLLVNAFIKTKIPFFITFFLTQNTQSQRNKILEFAQEHWNGIPSFAEICFRESIDKDFRFSHIQENIKPLTPWRSIEEFFFRVDHNSCTYGNFEVCSDGKLRTCSGIHKVHGDIAENGINKALSNNDLYDLWDLSKGDVDPCKHCALRYACTDCSVLELAGEKDSIIKHSYCPFDPDDHTLKACEKDWSPKEFCISLNFEKPSFGKNNN